MKISNFDWIRVNKCDVACKNGPVGGIGCQLDK